MTLFPCLDGSLRTRRGASAVPKSTLLREPTGWNAGFSGIRMLESHTSRRRVRDGTPTVLRCGVRRQSGLHYRPSPEHEAAADRTRGKTRTRMRPGSMRWADRLQTRPPNPSGLNAHATWPTSRRPPGKPQSRPASHRTRRHADPSRTPPRTAHPSVRSSRQLCARIVRMWRQRRHTVAPPHP